MPGPASRGKPDHRCRTPSGSSALLGEGCSHDLARVRVKFAVVRVGPGAEYPIDPFDSEPALHRRLLGHERTPPDDVAGARHPEHVEEGVPRENLWWTTLRVEQDDDIRRTLDVQLRDDDATVDDLINDLNTARRWLVCPAARSAVTRGRGGCIRQRGRRSGPVFVPSGRADLFVPMSR